GYDEVLELVADAGFAAEPAVEESFPFETLTVLALRRE
ncbi:methyltransferase, partial [Halorubrum sp. E3]